jgi:2-polyprenyl-3-methyl-5-hydroxy-6-metoxy-1,4-benzoquinol methylase
MNRYDDIYHQSPAYFGEEPANILTLHRHLIVQGGSILDIGAGQGRNTLFLARLGYRVVAVEPSPVAVNRLRMICEQERLSLRVCCDDFESYNASGSKFDAVLLFGIMQILSVEDNRLLLERVAQWLQPNGLVFLTAFSIDDPSYARNAQTLQRVTDSSFMTELGEFRTYLKPHEILTLFPDFKVIHHWEGLGKAHSHGGGKPHQHGVVEAVLRR